MERAIEIVINNFHRYAVKGRKECLTPNELRELVVHQLPQLSQVRGALSTAPHPAAGLGGCRFWDRPLMSRVWSRATVENARGEIPQGGGTMRGGVGVMQQGGGRGCPLS